MKHRAGDYERDCETGLLLPRHARRGGPRVLPGISVGPNFFAAGGSGGGGSGDPLFANVLLLLNCPGANGSTTLTDSSSYARTATRNGTPTITTAGMKTGAGAMLLDGVGDNWTYPDNSVWDLMFNEFCIEGTAYKDFSGQVRFLLSHRAISGPDVGWFIYVDATDKLRFTSVGTLTQQQVALTSTSTISSGATFDFSIARNSAAVRMFINGTLQASATGYVPTQDSNGLLYVGSSSVEDGSRDWKGKLGPLRITAGNSAVRYTSDYVPSSSAFPTSA